MIKILPFLNEERKCSFILYGLYIISQKTKAAMFHMLNGMDLSTAKKFSPYSSFGQWCISSPWILLIWGFSFFHLTRHLAGTITATTNHLYKNKSLFRNDGNEVDLPWGLFLSFPLLGRGSLLDDNHRRLTLSITLMGAEERWQTDNYRSQS